MDPIQSIFAEAQANRGPIRVARCYELGAGRKQVRTLLDKGILRHVARGVVAPAGAPETWDFNVMTGIVLAGSPGNSEGVSSAACSITACITSDLLVNPLYPVHILTTRQVAPREGFVFRRTGRLPMNEIVVEQGIPATDPIRSFLDLCDTHPGLAPFAYVRGLHKNRFLEDAVLERIDRESRQGRGGLARARQIIESTDPNTAGGASTEEDIVYGWIRDAGLPLPERCQYVASSFGWKWEIDLLYRRRPPIATDVSPWQTHSHPATYDKDHLKRNDLMAQGYTVLVVSNPDQKTVFLKALAKALENAR